MMGIKIEQAMQTMVNLNVKGLTTLPINKDLGIAYWAHQNDQLNYYQSRHHTLSLYLQGGYTTRRLDKDKSNRGGPGRFCLMPADVTSCWEVGVEQKFVHLYISDDHLKFFAQSTFELDARQLELPELTFFDDNKLRHLFDVYLLHGESGLNQNSLLMIEAVDEILAYLMTRYLNRRNQTQHLVGGLSGKQIQQVKDYVYAYYHHEISLTTLAKLCGLSTFHFARMFKLNCGISPYKFVQDVRIKRSQEMLSKNYRLSDIALNCGFSHQSHYSRVFKQHIGVTPKQYQRLISQR